MNDAGIYYIVGGAVFHDNDFTVNMLRIGCNGASHQVAYNVCMALKASFGFLSIVPAVKLVVPSRVRGIAVVKATDKMWLY